jgi:hypothetical protein
VEEKYLLDLIDLNEGRAVLMLESADEL